MLYADMAEWQTRKLEVFVGRPVLVQVQLSAPSLKSLNLFIVKRIVGIIIPMSEFEKFQVSTGINNDTYFFLLAIDK